MELEDIVRLSGILIAFVLVIRDRNIWMRADMLLSIMFGTALLTIPKYLMNFTIDGVISSQHKYVASLLGCVLVSCTLVWFLTNDTRDGTVKVTLLQSRVFMCGAILISLIYSHWGTSIGKKNIKYNEQNIYFNMMGVSLWMIGNFLHLLMSDDYSSYPHYNIRINMHLNIDSWLVCMNALALLAFPDFVNRFLFISSKPDILLYQLIRSIGGVLFGSCLISLKAPGFLHEHDKRAFFLCRLLCYIGLNCGLSAIYVIFGEFKQQAVIYCALLSLPVIINAGIAYTFFGGSYSIKLKGQ